MIPPPWEPEKTEVDYLVCSHEHGDHMDTESIPLWLSQNQNRIIAGPDSVTEICKSTVSKNKYAALTAEIPFIWGNSPLKVCSVIMGI